MGKKRARKVIDAHEDEKIQYLVAQINQMRIESSLTKDAATKERLDMMRRFLASKLLST